MTIYKKWEKYFGAQWLCYYCIACVRQCDVFYKDFVFDLSVMVSDNVIWVVLVCDLKDSLVVAKY